MSRKQLLISFSFLFFSAPLFSQGFTAPSEGNAVIYFVRIVGFGKSSSFEYFRNEEFIGIFKGKNYMRFETPPSESLFWASSENKQFLKCDLKAGEIYIVLVEVNMGAWKAQLALLPISIDNPSFNRIVELVNSKKPVVTSESTIQKTQLKLAERGFVENILDRFENEWKNSDITKVISQEMYIPLEKLQ